MKHIRMFEDEGDMLTRYREFYGLGLIGLEDYYRDLEEAGYPIERTYIEGEPRLMISTQDPHLRRWISNVVRYFEGPRDERIVDFSIDIQGRDQTVNARLSTGLWFRYSFEGMGQGRVRSARLDGRRLDEEDLVELNRTVDRLLRENGGGVQHGVIHGSVLTAVLHWLGLRLRSERDK